MAETTFFDDVGDTLGGIFSGAGDVLEPFAQDAGSLAKNVDTIRSAFSSSGGGGGGGGGGANVRKLRKQRAKAKARADALALQVAQLEGLLEEQGRDTIDPQLGDLADRLVEDFLSTAGGGGSSRGVSTNTLLVLGGVGLLIFLAVK